MYINDHFWTSVTNKNTNKNNTSGRYDPEKLWIRVRTWARRLVSPVLRRPQDLSAQHHVWGLCRATYGPFVFLGEWFIHDHCAQRGPASAGRQEPLPAAVNCRHGDGGLPKSLPPAAPFDGRLTSDLHKWLRDSPSGLRLIAAVTPNAPECKLWRPESSSLSVGAEVWIPPGPHRITFILLSSSTTFTGFMLMEN